MCFVASDLKVREVIAAVFRILHRDAWGSLESTRGVVFASLIVYLDAAAIHDVTTSHQVRENNCAISFIFPYDRFRSVDGETLKRKTTNTPRTKKSCEQN